MNLGSGIESSFITELVFWSLSILIVSSAIAVVQLKDLFRAALFLIVTFLGVAGMFILLRAEFIAGVQLMVYVGAISVLIIFAILLTRDLEDGSPAHSFRIPVALVAITFVLIAIYSIVNTDWSEISAISGDLEPEVIKVFSNAIPSLSKMLLSDFVLAFEVVSVLLLSVVIASLSIVRER
jgi:NADH-quinone oxidoreductase subunit J